MIFSRSSNPLNGCLKGTICPQQLFAVIVNKKVIAASVAFFFMLLGRKFNTTDEAFLNVLKLVHPNA